MKKLAVLYSCQTYVPRLPGFEGYFFSAEVRRPEVQEHLIRKSEEARVYVANCNGWMRPFIPATKMSLRSSVDEGAYP